MRIAIFSDTFLPQLNGVAVVAYRSALSLAEMGHDVQVFTATKHSPEEKEKITQNKFKIKILPSFSVWAYPGERFVIPIGMTLPSIRRFKPDVIHSHTPFGTGWEAFLASKLFGIPLVGTHHTFFDHYLRHIKLDYEWAKKPSWKYITTYYNRCHHVLSLSKVLAEELKLHGLYKPTDAFPNPIDTDLFKPAPDAAEKKKIKTQLGIKGGSVIYFGRLSYEKSVDQVIKAFKIVSDEAKDAKLMIAGSGPEKSNLEKQVKDLGMEEKVIFIPYEPDKKSVAILRANDLFVTASKSENMPLAMLEAMACGLPIVAPNALGIPEIVKNNINGFLVPPDNSHALAQKMLELIKDTRLRKKFGKASREMALNYSQEKIAESLENIYKKVTKK